MYIKDLSCISPQGTFDGEIFSSGPVEFEGIRMEAREPKYEEIPNSMLRRMGRSNRMAIGAGMPLLKKWSPDGIILGTSDGGMEDCHKFLNQMVAYDEGTLTPTGFVQGAPSTLAGTLALMSSNTGYNNTHSNLGLSFEASLIDARILFDDGGAETLLVGAVEEISEARSRIASLMNGSSAQKHGEGAAMFILSPNANGAKVQIRDEAMTSYPTNDEIISILENCLERNELKASQIDLLICDNASSASIGEGFLDIPILDHKELFGESASSSAFATWLGAELISGKQLPWIDLPPLSNVLVLNNFQKVQFGAILISAVDPPA